MWVSICTGTGTLNPTLFKGNCSANMRVMNNKLHGLCSAITLPGWGQLLRNCKTVQKISELLIYCTAKFCNK